MSQDLNQNNETVPNGLNLNHSSSASNPQNRTFSNEVFSWEVYAGKNRTYFFTLKEDKNNELYMTIKEVRYCADGTKDVHRIIVFEKDFANFQQGFNNSVSFVKGRRPQAFAPRVRHTFDRPEAQNRDIVGSPDIPITIVSDLNSPLPVAAFVTPDDVLELN